MTPENFADLVSRITYFDGLVRIDFMRLLPAEQEGEAPRQELVQRMVMPLRGLLQGMATAQELVRNLEGKGVLHRAAPGTAPETATSVGASASDQLWSPNFPKA